MGIIRQIFSHLVKIEKLLKTFKSHTEKENLFLFLYENSYGLSL